MSYNYKRGLGDQAQPVQTPGILQQPPQQPDQSATTDTPSWWSVHGYKIVLATSAAVIAAALWKKFGRRRNGADTPSGLPPPESPASPSGLG